MSAFRCLIRNEAVEATPEEEVRQKLLHHMIHNLSFPKELISVEKSLDQMPHIESFNEIPKRRADIICFGKGIHLKYSLYPLLLIECKAIKLTPKAIQQVIGYNYFIKSHYICIANGKEISTGWFDPQNNNYSFIPYLPNYQDLISNLGSVPVSEI